MGLICFEYDDIIFQPKKCMVVRAKQPHLPPMASHEFLNNFSKQTTFEVNFFKDSLIESKKQSYCWDAENTRIRTSTFVKCIESQKVIQPTHKTNFKSTEFHILRKKSVFTDIFLKKVYLKHFHKNCIMDDFFLHFANAVNIFTIFQ